MPEISANKMRVDVKSWLHRLPARYCRRQPCRTLISRQVSTKEFQRERFRLPTGQLLNSPLQSSGMTTSLSRSRMYDSEKRSSERHEQESRPYLPVEKKTQGSQVKRITHVCIYIYMHIYLRTYHTRLKGLDVSFQTSTIGSREPRVMPVGMSSLSGGFQDGPQEANGASRAILSA